MPAFGVVSMVVDSTTFTYNPSNLTGGVAYNVDRNASTYPAGFGLLSRSTRGPVSGNGLYRVSLKLQDPVVGDADSACGCAGELEYVDSVSIEFVLSERSTAAQRTALRKKAIALLGTAGVVSQVDSLEYVWS